MISEVIIAVVGALVSVSVLYLGKREDRKAKEREIKERKYVGFLEALIGWKASGEGGDEVSRTLQAIYLVGDKEVVRKTSDLISSLENQEKLSKACQDDLYTTMIYAMKKDLYHVKSGRNHPDRIGLTVFKDNSKETSF